MGLMEVNTTYEPFANEPEYIEANRKFIRSVNFDSARRILDLASGTGTMTDLILEILHDPRIVLQLDICRESLLIARSHLQERGLIGRKHCGSSNGLQEPEMLLAQATADTLPLSDLNLDVVIMGNSIHILPDKEKLMAEVCRVLKPDGIFAFNSSFYAGTMPPGTEKFNHEWMKQAARYLIRKDEEYRRQGLGGIRRKRGSKQRAFSKKWLSAMDWVEILERQGFNVKNVFERTVFMNQRCFETVGAYAGLASVLFSGYPVDLASEALQLTAGSALSAVNMEVVPRLWLEITAIKKK